MKLYYPIQDSKIASAIVQEDYEKIDGWKLQHQDYILQEEIIVDGARQHSETLKLVDGIVILKKEDDYKADRIAIAEATVSQANTKCMAYQTGETDPRIDPNFYSTIIVGYGMMKSIGAKTAETCPCCQVNTNWINALWQVVWVDVKTKIRAGNEYSLDFAQLMIDAGFTANPPHSFDECYAELM